MVAVYFKTAKMPQITRLEKPRDGSWIYAEEPSEQELDMLAKQFDLDSDLLRDGIDLNEAPRIERDGEVIYIFTRYCLPEQDRLTTAPLLIIYGRNEVITIARRPFAGVHELVHGNTLIFTSKRTQLILQLLSEVNNGYKRRINQVGRQVLQIRNQLDKSSILRKDFIAMIDIEEDLNDFLLVLEPMNAVLNNLLNGRFMRLYEEDRDLIEDLSLGTQELIQLARSRLTTIRNIRDAYSTIAADDLNRIFKRLTSITVFIGLCNIVTSFYGMNIRLPFMSSSLALWAVSGFIVALLGGSYLLFKKRNWL